MTWLLDAHRDPRTWQTLGYLLLSFPMALLGFVVIVTALALGAGLLVALLGIPVLVVTLKLVGSFASAERSLAEWLLHAPFPRQAIAPPAAPVGLFWRALLSKLGRSSTWYELAWVLFVALPVAVVNFTVGTGIIGLALGGFAQPVLYVAGVEQTIGNWEITSFGQSFIFVPASLFFYLVGPRLLMGWREVPARLTTRLLGHVDRDEYREAIGRATEDQELDGAGVAVELERQFGPGPWLDPIRVQATLEGMAAAGTLRSRPDDGGRTLYRAAV